MSSLHLLTGQKRGGRRGKCRALSVPVWSSSCVLQTWPGTEADFSSYWGILFNGFSETVSIAGITQLKFSGDWLSSVQFSSLSRVRLFATPWIAAHQAALSITNSWSLLKLMSIKSVMPSATSSSVIPFSSCSQSLPASGSFPMSQLFAWGGQSIGVSGSASVLPMNTQYWSPLGWIGWISLQSKGLSRVFSNTTAQKHQFFGAQLSSQSNSHIHIYDHWKNHSLDSTDLCLQSNVSAF